jgi:5-methylcytosine-specific restriction endonuclease McrA
MSNALVLNATFEPLQIVSWQKAIQLLFQGKVEVIEESEREIRTVSFTIKIPAVLRLLNFVPLKNKKELVRFSRSNVFLRDQYRCQYCNKKPNASLLTLDHVIPIVQGGEKSWKNIVTACKPCNQKKGGRTPQEAKMKLIRPPQCPQWLPASHLSFKLAISPERWKFYLRFSHDETTDDPEL